MGELVFLDRHDLLLIHHKQIKTYGGEDGIRDLGMLEAALEMPRAGMGGEYFHKTPEEMAAAYLFHIVNNHPFVDGNKRVALAAAFHFLDLNGIELRANPLKLRDLVLGAAASKVKKTQIAVFLKKFGCKK